MSRLLRRWQSTFLYLSFKVGNVCQISTERTAATRSYRSSPSCLHSQCIQNGRQQDMTLDPQRCRGFNIDAHLTVDGPRPLGRAGRWQVWGYDDERRALSAVTQP